MGVDRTENEPEEPEEYDPEAEFRDPDSDSLTIPRVPTEDAGSTLRSDLQSEFEEELHEEFQADASAVGTTVDADVDGDLLTTFWALVLVVNVAVIAFSLGLLFLIFEGATTTASYLVAAGLLLTGFAIRRYRNVQRDLEAADDEEDDPSAEPTADDETGESPTDGGDAEADTAADGKH